MREGVKRGWMCISVDVQISEGIGKKTKSCRSDDRWEQCRPA